MVDTTGERTRPCPRESSRGRVQWATSDRGGMGFPRSASLFCEWGVGVGDLKCGESLQHLMHESVQRLRVAGPKHSRSVYNVCSSSTEEEEETEAAGTSREMAAGICARKRPRSRWVLPRLLKAEQDEGGGRGLVCGIDESRQNPGHGGRKGYLGQKPGVLGVDGTCRKSIRILSILPVSPRSKSRLSLVLIRGGRWRAEGIHPSS